MDQRTATAEQAMLASKRTRAGDREMSQYIQPDNGFAEIMAGKQKRRDALLRAVSQASPDDIEAAAQRIKEVMRESKGNQRRQRISPPAFFAR